MVCVAHLKNKMRFTSRNFKFKIPQIVRTVLHFHNMEFTKSKTQGQS